MSKKLKIIVSTILAVVVLSGTGAATVMARVEPAPQLKAITANATNANDLLARVARILGVPRDKLVDAFEQARREITNEAPRQTGERRFLTEVQVEKIKERYQAQPGERQEIASELLSKLLAIAEKEGLFTPDEAGQIKDWWETRPDAVDRLFSRDHILLMIPGPQVAASEKTPDEISEFLDEMLDKAQAKELISPDEALQVREWWASRPAAVDRLFSLGPALLIKQGPRVTFPGKALERGRVPPTVAEKIKEKWAKKQQTQAEISPKISLKFMEKLIEMAEKKGLISPEEAEQIRNWWNNRPEAVDTIISGPRIMPAVRTTKQIIVPKGWIKTKPNAAK